MNHRRLKHFLLATAVGPLALAFTGCATAYKHRHERDQHGHVFYLDGAGGGHALSPWASGVRRGLEMSGYPGDFYTFPWNTGLGVPADQSASVEYKRGKAKRLAQLIREYQREHPGQPVTLIGLSAGTAIAVFTLEELSPSHPVDSVVLLGSSLSAHYDLTKALTRVKERVVVYTSPKDSVLAFLVPIAGTADREYCGACAAGLSGFHLTQTTAKRPESLQQYHKLENVEWRSEFAQAGNYGGHTDSVNPRFVRDYVAPIVRASGPMFRDAGMQPRPENEPASPPPGPTT